MRAGVVHHDRIETPGEALPRPTPAAGIAGIEMIGIGDDAPGSAVCNERSVYQSLELLYLGSNQVLLVILGEVVVVSGLPTGQSGRANRANRRTGKVRGWHIIRIVPTFWEAIRQR